MRGYAGEIVGQGSRPRRLAVVASHPVQYHGPLFRELASRLDLTVFYCHEATSGDQAAAGFDVHFEWDVDLLVGYGHEFLTNVAPRPALDRFSGVDTPEIGARLRSGRFDAVLLMGWYLKCFLQAMFAAKRAHIPVMVRGDSHLKTPRSQLKKAAKAVLYPHFLRQFDAALVVGLHNAAYWEHYGYPAERMFDAPHCVDTEWFATRARPEAGSALRRRLGIALGAPVLLFAGKLVESKRPRDVVEAAAQARGQGVPAEVMIAGSGPLEADVRAIASDLDVPLHMLGFCNQSEMPEAYVASDVLVLPSSETWGLVTNEALACGRPILVSDAVGCAPDMMMRLGAGVVYPMGDVAALAARLIRIFDGPPAAAVIAAASADFSLSAAADGVERAVASLSGPRVIKHA